MLFIQIELLKFWDYAEIRKGEFMASPKDAFFEEQYEWKNWNSEHRCFYCGNPIQNKDLKNAFQSDGRYIHPDCLQALEKLDKE